MNEASTNINPIAGIEAYIRNSISNIRSSINQDNNNNNNQDNNNNKIIPPKLIIKDTHMAIERKELLKYYYDYSIF